MSRKVCLECDHPLDERGLVCADCRRQWAARMRLWEAERELLPRIGLVRPNERYL